MLKTVWFFLTLYVKIRYTFLNFICQNQLFSQLDFLNFFEYLFIKNQEGEILW